MAEESTFNSSIYTSGSQSAANEAYDSNIPSSDLTATLGVFIQALLGLLGVIFLVLIIYAGVTWMTAGGNPDNVKKAKQVLTNAVIGLILTLAAYAISYFVIGLVG